MYDSHPRRGNLTAARPTGTPFLLPANLRITIYSSRSARQMQAANLCGPNGGQGSNSHSSPFTIHNSPFSLLTSPFLQIPHGTAAPFSGILLHATTRVVRRP